MRLESQLQLKVGDIVRVQGIITGPKHDYAQSISVVHLVIGPAEEVSEVGRRAVILEQRMEALGVPVFAGLKRGRGGSGLSAVACQGYLGCWRCLAYAKDTGTAGRLRFATAN